MPWSINRQQISQYIINAKCSCFPFIKKFPFNFTDSYLPHGCSAYIVIKGHIGYPKFLSFRNANAGKIDEINSESMVSIL